MHTLKDRPKLVENRLDEVKYYQKYVRFELQ